MSDRTRGSAPSSSTTLLMLSSGKVQRGGGGGGPEYVLFVQSSGAEEGQHVGLRLACSSLVIDCLANLSIHSCPLRLLLGFGGARGRSPSRHLVGRGQEETAVGRHLQTFEHCPEHPQSVIFVQKCCETVVDVPQ